MDLPSTALFDHPTSGARGLRRRRWRGGRRRRGGGCRRGARQRRRAAAPAPRAPLARPRRASAGDAAAVAAAIGVLLVDLTGTAAAADTPLMSAGLDSVGSGEFAQALGAKFGVELESTALFDHPTSGALVEYLCGQMGGGGDAVGEAAPRRRRGGAAAPVGGPVACVAAAPRRVTLAPSMAPAPFRHGNAFAISVMEARVMDPQHSLSSRARTRRAATGGAALSNAMVGFFLGMGGLSSFAPGNADAKASTSIYEGTAFTLSRLRRPSLGECPRAVATGISLITASVTAALAPRACSATRPLPHARLNADGYCRGEGCGSFLAADDYAVDFLDVAGTAVQQDGPSASLTAPNGSSQQRLLATPATRGAPPAPSPTASSCPPSDAYAPALAGAASLYRKAAMTKVVNPRIKRATVPRDDTEAWDYVVYDVVVVPPTTQAIEARTRPSSSAARASRPRERLAAARLRRGSPPRARRPRGAASCAARASARSRAAAYAWGADVFCEAAAGSPDRSASATLQRAAGLRVPAVEVEAVVVEAVVEEAAVAEAGGEAAVATPAELRAMVLACYGDVAEADLINDDATFETLARRSSPGRSSRMNEALGFSSEKLPPNHHEFDWCYYQNNVFPFYETIVERDASQAIRATYEELVTQPGGLMKRVCTLLDLAYEPHMATPYQTDAVKMLYLLKYDDLQHRADNTPEKSGLTAGSSRPWRRCARRRATTAAPGSSTARALPRHARRLRLSDGVDEAAALRRQDAGLLAFEWVLNRTHFYFAKAKMLAIVRHPHACVESWRELWQKNNRLQNKDADVPWATVEASYVEQNENIRRFLRTVPKTAGSSPTRASSRTPGRR
ncbi:hypothetical protein JL721_11739 [Aureococcus anophagefferens]|nr:hypothetical protein JL721_11739 [Aureococcus anophagefferens]